MLRNNKSSPQNRWYKAIQLIYLYIHDNLLRTE